MALTFPFGYSTPPARLTLAEMNTRPTWTRLDAEFRDRLSAMFVDAASKGVSLGLGGGWRSSAIQRATFLERHVQVPSGGCCSYMGQRWALKPNAHAAPPGASYHEETQRDGDALAADLIGDLFWMNANCWRFRLVHFGGVNKEPWHVQPVEIPTGRPRYNGAELVPWRPPSTPDPITTDDEDEMPIVTNAEPFFGAAVGVAKFAVQDSGRLLLLGEPEWRARGAKAGTPLSNADIGALGVDQR